MRFFKLTHKLPTMLLHDQRGRSIGTNGCATRYYSLNNSKNFFRIMFFGLASWLVGSFVLYAMSFECSMRYKRHIQTRNDQTHWLSVYCVLHINIIYFILIPSSSGYYYTYHHFVYSFFGRFFLLFSAINPSHSHLLCFVFMHGFCFVYKRSTSKTYEQNKYNVI